MSDAEIIDELKKAGAALADAMGHAQGCPKVSSGIPCVCGKGFKQAKALGDWNSLVRRLKSS